MFRRIVVFAVMVAVAIAAFAAPAGAVPFTTAFDALKADLEARRANDYPPPLTAAKRKEKKGIDQSLARLGKTHEDLVDDVSSAAFVAKALKTGFPREFSPKTATSGLAGLVAGVFQNLVAAAETEYGRLDDALAVVTDAADRTAATAKLTAARKALDVAANPATTPAAAAKQLLRALKAAQQGFAIARPYVDGFLAARVNGRTFAATHVTTEYFAAAPYLNIVASFVHPQTGAKQRIVILVRSPGLGKHEIGAFDIFAGNFAVYAEGDPADDITWYSQFTEPASNVEFTEFDADTGRVAGTFSFLAMRNGNSTKKVTGGRFLLTGVTLK